MNEQIKKDNRKALPKFLLILVVCMLLGGVVGGLSVIVSISDVSIVVREGIARGLTVIAPWGIPVVSVVLLVPAFCFLRQAKKALTAWDGEDEETSERIELLENRVMLLSNVTLLLDIFFFSVAFIYDIQGVLLTVVLFLLSMGLCTFFQQKVVDQIRVMNPEKQGSVYETKFQKKWIDSCDELERRQIGEAAFKAFQAGNVTCIVLWMVLIVSHIIFATGLLPIVVVLVIWGVMLLVYQVTASKMGRRKQDAEKTV